MSRSSRPQLMAAHGNLPIRQREPRLKAPHVRSLDTKDPFSRTTAQSRRCSPRVSGIDISEGRRGRKHGCAVGSERRNPKKPEARVWFERTRCVPSYIYTPVFSQARHINIQCASTATQIRSTPPQRYCFCLLCKEASRTHRSTCAFSKYFRAPYAS